MVKTLSMSEGTLSCVVTEVDDCIPKSVPIMVLSSSNQEDWNFVKHVSRLKTIIFGPQILTNF